MLVFIPLFAFFVLFLENLSAKRGEEYIDWREAFLRSALVLAAWQALSSEGLSLFKLLTTGGVVLSWSLAVLAALLVGMRTGSLRTGWQRLKNSAHILQRGTLLALLGFGVVLAMLLLIAWVAVPNNTDSLQYHMSRVVHWAQNRGLQHYPTVTNPQLWNPIWAEEAILHLRLLYGSDKLANMVQWLAMFGSLLGVSLIAGQLGAGKWGQFSAAAFALSLPIGILQSTSTQNDYVVAFWLVTLAFFVLRSASQPLTRLETFYLALALGIGLLTKGTAYPYVTPFVAWYFIARFIRLPRLEMLRTGLLLVGVVLILNAPYWLRNIGTYGGPLGSGEWVESRTAGKPGVRSWVVAVARNALQNFPTPYESANVALADRLVSFQERLGLEATEFQLIWGWNHEDLAGNPLHAGLLVLNLLALPFLSRRLRDQQTYAYSAIALATFLVLALVVTYDPYGVRYQLPFWICWAPVFGVTISLISEKRLAPLVISGLLVASLPWVLFSRTRPLISMRPSQERMTIPCYLDCTATGSILLENAPTILLANWLELREPYLDLSQAIKSSGCQDVGLRLDSHDAEYPFWYLLDAPQSGIHIESLYYYPFLEKYVDQSFKPCAIICTICGAEVLQLNGLDYTGSFANIRLYQGANFQVSPDK